MSKDDREREYRIRAFIQRELDLGRDPRRIEAKLVAYWHLFYVQARGFIQEILRERAQ